MHMLSGEPDLSMVDQVPWAELHHAYGSAIDVPSQFQSLVSPDAEVRRRTIYSFTCNIFHQGSVYPATVAAIPIFQHLLRYKQVADKSKILELLASFAVGFTDDVIENVDLGKFIGGTSNNSDSEDHADARECYLAVGAGVPLYELLLGDSDPRVVISASFTLAFFPAHAFASCRALLALARDNSHHAFVRSSALIACSYLNGGPVREDFLQVLRAHVAGESPDDDEALPFLCGTAVYCLLREQQPLEGTDLRSRIAALANRCLQRGIQLPDCSLYRVKKVDRYEDLLMPDPQFPWGDLTKRIRRHTTVPEQDEAPMQLEDDDAVPDEHQGPEVISFDVKPDVFHRDNVIAAVRRFRARFGEDRWGGPAAVQEFAPFKPYLMVAWDEVLRLLDSDVDEDRWAAADMIEHLGPLDESAVDQLIERLHRGDNNHLGTALRSLPVSQRQCQSLCDRYCGDDVPHSQGRSARDDALAVVIKHGTVDQVRRILDECESEWKSSAARELCDRGHMEPPAALPVFAAALLSSDYGTRMSANWLFANWTPAQHWFLQSYESLPDTQRWAIAGAMSTFGADLSEQQDELFTRISAEKNPLLSAKLVRLMARF